MKMIFLKLFDIMFKREEDNFSREIPLQQFRFLIKLTHALDGDDDDDGDDSDDGGNISQIINIKLTFKNDEYVICLTNSPNVLFCNCGHVCVCDDCDAMKCLDVCPMCKTKTTINKRII